jgi:ketosteroid isomerase-like protein
MDMNFRARGQFAFLILFLLLSTAGIVRADSEDEVKAVFAKFVAAQNAHDLKEVGALLQDSAQFLWITRGLPVWGHDAAIKRFEALYQGTWSLDPKMDELKVVELQPGVVAQLYVPITFMIGPAGQTAQPTRFLMNQVLVKAGDSWKITSILPIPAPQQ